MFNHLSCINFSLQYFVSLHYSNICFTSSFSKHNGHLPLSEFLLTPFSCHIPAINHAIPLVDRHLALDVISNRPDTTNRSETSTSHLDCVPAMQIWLQPRHRRNMVCESHSPLLRSETPDSKVAEFTDFIRRSRWKTNR